MNKLSLIVRAFPSLSLLLLVACGGGGGASVGAVNDERATYLNVSVTDFYFGTRNVGTSTDQQIELTNWSGDIYPINKLTINGQDAEEFGVDFHGGVSLGPSQKIALNLTFTPVTDGVKTAQLDVDYDVIPQVTAAANQNEQLFYAAAAHEDSRDYKKSLKKYQQYLDGKPVTVNKKRAAIKLPVLAESGRYGTGRDFSMYVAAMNQRDDGNLDNSIQLLNKLIAQYPKSFLADDAQYFKGYIQLMDQKDYLAASHSLQTFRKKFPDSSYRDTALYAEAQALENLGKHAMARARYFDLMDLHRSTSVMTLGLNVAKDNFVSRMWFERADRGMNRLKSL